MMDIKLKSFFKTLIVVIIGIILNITIIVGTTYFCRSLKAEEKKAREFISDNDNSLSNMEEKNFFDSKNKDIK